MDALDVELDYEKLLEPLMEMYQSSLDDDDLLSAASALNAIREMYDDFYRTLSDMSGMMIVEDDGFSFGYWADGYFNKIGQDVIDYMERELQGTVSTLWSEMCDLSEGQLENGKYDMCQVETVRDMYFDGIYAYV